MRDEVELLQNELEEGKSVLTQLKVLLYAKFGKAINLEMD